MSPKILFIDDDLDDHMILIDAMDILNHNGTLEVSTSWHEAQKNLQQAFQTNQLPNLIILDLNMPLVSGSEILAQLKQDERFKTIPVIIYSTSINNLEKQKCMQLGASDYITKPITYAESLTTAKSFLDFCNL